MTAARSVRRAVPYLLPPLLLVGLGLFFFVSTGRDDSHITFWAAHHLAETGEILNYNGERVEQSSSLLHVVVLALLDRLSGVEPANLAGVLSILFGAATVAAVHRLAERIRAGTGLAAALLTATSSVVVYWSFGKLETPIVPFTAIVLILTWAQRNRTGGGRLAAAVAVALPFVAVRPEMPIVLICMLAAAWLIVALRRVLGRSDRNGEADPVETGAWLARLLVVAVGSCALLFGFRYAYFGRLFPQPVGAKASLSIESVVRSVYYIGEQLFAEPFISIAVVVTAVCVLWTTWRQLRAERLDPHVVLTLGFLASYTAFILCSGGDWMEAGRLPAHMLPVALALVPAAVGSMVRTQVATRVVLAAIVGVQLLALVSLARTEATGLELPRALRYYRSFGEEWGASRFTWFERTNRIHLRDIPMIHVLDEIVGRLLANRDGQVTILTTQMGMVPYHVLRAHPGRIRTVDRNGLTDRTLTECSVTAGVRRTPSGLALPYGFYFDRREAIERETGMPRPDIIFDLYVSGELMRLVEQRGYRVVHVQFGQVAAQEGWLPGSAVRANQFIAVREDLLPELEGMRRRRVDFVELQPPAVADRRR